MRILVLALTILCLVWTWVAANSWFLPVAVSGASSFLYDWIPEGKFTLTAGYLVANVALGMAVLGLAAKLLVVRNRRHGFLYSLLRHILFLTMLAVVIWFATMVYSSLTGQLFDFLAGAIAALAIVLVIAANIFFIWVATGLAAYFWRASRTLHLAPSLVAAGCLSIAAYLAIAPPGFELEDEQDISLSALLQPDEPNILAYGYPIDGRRIDTRGSFEKHFSRIIEGAWNLINDTPFNRCVRKIFRETDPCGGAAKGAYYKIIRLNKGGLPDDMAYDLIIDSAILACQIKLHPNECALFNTVVMRQSSAYMEKRIIAEKNRCNVQPPCPNPSADEIVYESELLALADDALCTLTSTEQKLMRMAIKYEMDCDRIASETGYKIGYVKRTIWKAKKKIKAQINEHCNGLMKL